MFRLFVPLLVTLGLAQPVMAQIDSRTERQMAKAFTQAMADNQYLDSVTRGDADRAMDCMASVLIVTSLIYQNREQALRLSEQLSEAQSQNVFWHWKHEYERTAEAQVEPAALHAAVSRRNAAMVGQPEGMTTEMRHLGDCWVRPALMGLPEQKPLLRNVMAGLGFIPRQFAVDESKRESLRFTSIVQMSPSRLVLNMGGRPEDDSDEAFEAYMNKPYRDPDWLEATESLRNECFREGGSLIEVDGKGASNEKQLCYGDACSTYYDLPGMSTPFYTVVCERTP